MRKIITTILCFTFALLRLHAQTPQQVVRGTLADKESKSPIAGASVVVYADSTPQSYTLTDGNGYFRITGVTVGRRTLKVTVMGYKPIVMDNLIVTSGKEVVLALEMEENAIIKNEIVIHSNSRNGDPNNEMGMVSVRQFSVEETDRYAGSRGDPGRMASNFAGVQGADDSRNDIVIRGNSPQGVLWRVEGIDIPNPNHFSIPGTTGGSVSILNNKILANSDFFTGAFPSEYGNSTAGVFDLKLRNGNNEKHEFSSQLGFLGWEFMMEGPFSKKSKASYLVTYRYSTLALFSSLRIPIGTDAVPFYQDASFKINIPMGSRSNLNFWGIGGLSHINILISNQKESRQNLYGDNDRDQKFASSVGIIGSSFIRNISKNSYFRASVAFSRQYISAQHQLVFRTITGTRIDGEDTLNQYRLDSLVPNLNYHYRTNSLVAHAFVNRKFGSRATLRYGLNVTEYFYQFLDSNRNFDASSAYYWQWQTRWNTNATALLVQPYVQFKYALSSRLTGNIGWHMQYFSLGNAKSFIEPRLALQYQIKTTKRLTFGAGMHSQTQPGYTYFYMLPGNTAPHNLNMGFTRSAHVVMGYDMMIKKSLRFKSEVYYQYLYQVPVTVNPSSFSLVNTGSGFSRFFPDTLTNKGTGYNYGIEFTLERFFTKGFYYLTTLSLFDAKYKGSDGITRNSDFNTRYAFNALMAKEFIFKNKNSFNIGIKFTAAGPRRFSPQDIEASKRSREYVEIDRLKNSSVFGSAYRRLDLRVAYRINGKKMSHELALDIVNVTNRANILKYSYVNEAPYYKLEYQLGRLPLFYYKIDF